MKKFLTLAVVAVMAVSASAQKGSMYIGTTGISFYNNDNALAGGNLASPFLTGFAYNKNGDDKTTSFGLAPEFGYFIADNMVIGASLGFSYSSFDEDGADDKLNCTSFGIAPYFRYFLVQKGNFGLYLQAGGQFATSKYDYDDAESTTYFNVGVLPGISYSFSDKFSATASFGWLGYEQAKQDDAKMSEFGLNLDGSSLNFGLYYNF